MPNDENRRNVLISEGIHMFKRLNYLLFANRLNDMEVALLKVIHHFDKVEPWLGISFDKNWEEAAKIIVDDARFVFLSPFEASVAIDARWENWSRRIIRQLEVANPVLIYEPDQHVLGEFTARQSTARNQIWRTTIEMANPGLTAIGTYLASNQLKSANRRFKELTASLYEIVYSYESPNSVPLPSDEEPW